MRALWFSGTGEPKNKNFTQLIINQNKNPDTPETIDRMIWTVDSNDQEGTLESGAGKFRLFLKFTIFSFVLVLEKIDLNIAAY